ncbi:hypothetical protein ACFXI6_14355 [Streptomyces mirabilis]|uniref:hypothetical protein n=1 Tax=Streptomyces mirabilis TaxID=68239 RepID=UPI0036A4A6CA
MPIFKAKVSITDQSGNKREVSGPLSHPSPMYGTQRAEADAANQVRQQLKPGERITDVEARYQRG